MKLSMYKKSIKTGYLYLDDILKNLHHPTKTIENGGMYLHHNSLRLKSIFDYFLFMIIRVKIFILMVIATYCKIV